MDSTGKGQAVDRRGPGRRAGASLFTVAPERDRLRTSKTTCRCSTRASWASAAAQPPRPARTRSFLRRSARGLGLNECPLPGCEGCSQTSGSLPAPLRPSEPAQPGALPVAVRVGAITIRKHHAAEGSPWGRLATSEHELAEAARLLSDKVIFILAKRKSPLIRSKSRHVAALLASCPHPYQLAEV